MMCEMFSHIMLIFSRITMITVMIAFGFGWQVVYENTKDIKKHIQKIYLFVLLMTAYDDYAMSQWIHSHPSDFFHLMQSGVQWTFYLTKFCEFLIFSFAIWRSKRVSNNKLNESIQKIEDDKASSERTAEMHITTSSNIHSIRIQFFNQLFFVGSIYFISLPISTWICNNYIQESTQ